MKNIYELPKILFKVLTFLLAIFFIIALLCMLASSYKVWNFGDSAWPFALIGLLGSGSLWIHFHYKADDEQRKEKTAKYLEERKNTMEEALKSIWPYGSDSIMGVIEYESLIHICHVSVKYAGYADVYIISVTQGHGGYVMTDSYKATLKDNMLMATKDDKVIVLKPYSLQIGNATVDLNQDNPSLQRVQMLIEKFLNGEPIKTVKLSHLESCESEDVISELPKFTFTLTTEGVKCNQINLAERKLKQYFDKNAGTEYIINNEIFYREYCKDGYLPTFGIDTNRLNAYLSSASLRAIRMGLTNMNTDFEVATWDTHVKQGAMKLFQEMKGYASNRVAYYVPVVVSKTMDYIALEPPIIDLEDKKLNSNSMKMIAYTTWMRDYFQGLQNGGEADRVTIILTEHNETMISFDDECYVTHPCLRSNND